MARQQHQESKDDRTPRQTTLSPDPNATPPGTARGAMSAAEAKAQDMDTTRKDTYSVVGPGSIMFGGKKYDQGQTLELNELEAASLGVNVRRGEPPKPEKAGARRAGRYRVRGPGLVMHGGKQHGPGAVLELSEADARSLGASVEPEGAGSGGGPHGMPAGHPKAHGAGGLVERNVTGEGSDDDGGSKGKSDDAGSKTADDKGDKGDKGESETQRRR